MKEGGWVCPNWSNCYVLVRASVGFVESCRISEICDADIYQFVFLFCLHGVIIVS